MRQLTLDLAHRPRLGAEDFLIGAANREAVAWVARWPHWPAPGLAVFGPESAGKSHLAHLWAARSGASVVALATLAGAAPLALLGDRRALALDAADGPPGDERALLHLYNLVAGRGGHLLLTGRRPPAQWRVRLPDLGSRLAALPAVAVGAPDDALLGAVIEKLFADRRMPVAEEVVVYLLRRMDRSFATAGRLVAALDAAALAGRCPVSVTLARRVLATLRSQEQGES